MLGRDANLCSISKNIFCGTNKIEFYELQLIVRRNHIPDMTIIC